MILGNILHLSQKDKERNQQQKKQRRLEMEMIHRTRSYTSLIETHIPSKQKHKKKLKTRRHKDEFVGEHAREGRCGIKSKRRGGYKRKEKGHVEMCPHKTSGKQYSDDGLGLG